MSSIILIAALSEPARIAFAVLCAIAIAVVVVIASHSVLLALVAAAVVGGAAYYFTGGGQSSESSSQVNQTKEEIVEPPEVIYHEIVIPVRFTPNEENNDKNNRLSPTKPFSCKLKIDDKWISIEGPSQKDMLDQIHNHFQELKNRQTSDSKIVDNKKTETSFRIEVYKKPFPGDTILSELQKLSSECFKNQKFIYDIYDKEYPESENEGDDKQ